MLFLCDPGYVDFQQIIMYNKYTLLDNADEMER